jgi:hypothetical protein
MISERIEVSEFLRASQPEPAPRWHVNINSSKRDSSSPVGKIIQVVIPFNTACNHPMNSGGADFFLQQPAETLEYKTPPSREYREKKIAEAINRGYGTGSGSDLPVSRERSGRTVA